MFFVNEADIYQELKKNFAFAPAYSTQDLFEKLAEKNRNQTTSISSLKVYLTQQGSPPAVSA